MLDRIAEASLLYDFYGELLTEKQNEVMRLYHEENMSLGEIAEERGISRQGVYDTLKKAEKSLKDYEEKLGLVERFESNRKSIAEISNKLMIVEKSANGEHRLKLEEIRTLLESIEW